MDFLMIGSLNNYIKNLSLSHKWERKKETNDFSNDEKKTELQRKNEMFKKTYMEQKKKEEDNETLTNIHNKINAGAKLTPDEMKYLQAKDPEMYQKLQNLEKEKKQYEKDLKCCKTKDDVERLKFSKVSAALSSIGSVKNNPNIPEGYKLGVASFEMRKLSEFDKITAKFVKSGEYEKLPTDAEKLKAEHEIKEAEAAETEKILHQESPDEKDKNVKETAQEKPENPETEKTEPAENSGNASKAEFKAVTPEKSDDKAVIPDEKDISRMEAELTPEAKKLKYAKAKAAYKKHITPQETQPSEILFKGNTQINSIG